MRVATTKTNVYKFHELSEKAQQKAIEYFSDIDHEWWCYIYEDASEVGIKINGFDTGRRHEINADIEHNTPNLILQSHGDTCETYKLSKTFLKELKKITDNTNEDNIFLVNHDEHKQDELKQEYEHDLKQEYLAILTKEFEYLTSYEVIKETIEANDYEFTVEGVLF